MGEVCSTHGGEKCYGLLVGKPGEERPYGTPRRKWVDGSKRSKKYLVLGYELNVSCSGYGSMTGSC